MRTLVVRARRYHCMTLAKTSLTLTLFRSILRGFNKGVQGIGVSGRETVMAGKTMQPPRKLAYVKITSLMESLNKSKNISCTSRVHYAAQSPRLVRIAVLVRQAWYGARSCQPHLVPMRSRENGGGTRTDRKPNDVFSHEKKRC